jgi:hypothetical protein
MKKKQLPEKPRTIGGDVSEHIRQAFSDLELHMERRRAPKTVTRLNPANSRPNIPRDQKKKQVKQRQIGRPPMAIVTRAGAASAALSVSVSDRGYVRHPAVAEPNALHQFVRTEVVNPKFLLHVGHAWCHRVIRRWMDNLDRLPT